MRILVLAGDGIGPEITAATTAVLEAASSAFDLGLILEPGVIGLESLRLDGTTLAPAVIERARAVDGVILGPVATVEYPPESAGGVNPSAAFRKQLDLFANIRPSRTYLGIAARVEPFDLVIARENTEGFYADRNMAQGSADILVTRDVAVAMRRITRDCSERIAEAGFALARRRRRRVTLVHKANVLKVSDGLFLEACRAVAGRYPDIAVDDVLVDAMAAHLVRHPARFDVIVTTNMFGDILSDLTAELSGSLGLAGALNLGQDHAVAQATHGSAPDIAGRDRANPISLILSAAMLLDWHAGRAGAVALAEAARAIEAAVAAAIAAGETTRDVGGKLGTRAAGAAIAARLRR